MNWCDKHHINPCDFLFFALKKNIHREAPALEDYIQDIFEKFLDRKVGGQITLAMGLALKIEGNFSHRQYVTLSSKKILGKLPLITKVRREADKLDPGNVFYQVVSKASGEMIREHAAFLRLD